MKRVIWLTALLAAALISGILLTGGSDVVEIAHRETGSYPVDRYQAEAPTGTLIHAIGIYEGASNHGADNHPGADVTITIEDQGAHKIALALSSYEPVRWHLKGPGAGSVKAIYLAGYNRHTVDGATGARVVNESGRSQQVATFDGDRDNRDTGFPSRDSDSGPVACTITYVQPDGGGCDDADNLIDRAADRLRGNLATFTGVYNADRFVIHAFPGAKP